MVSQQEIREIKKEIEQIKKEVEQNKKLQEIEMDSDEIIEEAMKFSIFEKKYLIHKLYQEIGRDILQYIVKEHPEFIKVWIKSQSDQAAALLWHYYWENARPELDSAFMYNALVCEASRQQRAVIKFKKELESL